MAAWWSTEREISRANTIRTSTSYYQALTESHSRYLADYDHTGLLLGFLEPKALELIN